MHDFLHSWFKVIVSFYLALYLSFQIDVSIRINIISISLFDDIKSSHFHLILSYQFSIYNCQFSFTYSRQEAAAVNFEWLNFQSYHLAFISLWIESRTIAQVHVIFIKFYFIEVKFTRFCIALFVCIGLDIYIILVQI